MPRDRPAVTVVTSAYRAAATLERTFRSLLGQGSDVARWVVVDDRSGDGTDELVWRLAAQAPFEVVFEQQTGPRGKWRAVNQAMGHVQTPLVGILDADDEVVPGGLDLLVDAWCDIPPAQWDGYWAVVGRCVDAEGRRVGPPLPDVVVDLPGLDALLRRGFDAEHWSLVRADLMHASPFPDVDRFVPEGIVWARLAASHRVRMVDRPVRVYHEGTETLSRTRRVESPLGHAVARTCILSMGWDAMAPLQRLAAAGRVHRFAHWAGVPATDVVRSVPNLRARRLLAWTRPLGRAWAWTDRLRRRTPQGVEPRPWPADVVRTYASPPAPGGPPATPR